MSYLAVSFPSIHPLQRHCIPEAPGWAVPATRALGPIMGNSP